MAPALMVMRALGRHPLSGLTLDLRRYRVPRVSVCPVLHHVVFLAASGEVLTLCRRANHPIDNEAHLCRQLIFLPVRQQGPQNAGVFRG